MVAMSALNLSALWILDCKQTNTRKKAVLNLLADTLENQGLLEKTKNCPTCYILKNSWKSVV